MSIQLTRRDDFAVITLDRPAALNALNYATLQAIDEALDEVAAWKVRALLFTGCGDKAFCAGADISELLDRDIPDEYVGTRLGQSVFSRIESFPVPSVAAVNGYALGGGCELALACTFRVGTSSAKFGLPEVKLGLVPGYGGTQRLPRLVGVAAALDIVLTGRMVAADEALRIGLLHRIVHGDVIEAAMAYARGFTGHSMLAMRLIRDAVLRGVDTSLQDGLRIEADLSTISMNSEDGKEGPRAFIAKRAPRILDR
ncbi:enoyl-CoA hydratase [Verticiella sediminum]|uniref:Enoyl-CoA hydratase n=1 Tax=Verticiella sediminum TaxID=1247510 RepID=A0A556AIQ3_9BURK|nr:enoyl-CoA hydratase-related protein [Verticiella sediminum]TSH92746.1 enoyl-CoA hydratase [Verticiella sediminum]